MIPISDQTKIAAVIGDPISHSLSPKLHNYLINKYKINGVYLAFKIAPEDLTLCLKSFAKIGLKGCNVTIPHKEKAFSLCDHLSPVAIATKAVNTIVIDEKKELYGDNSDGIGFINNIRQNYPDFDFVDKKVVILGAGGAARSICFSLMQQKVSSIMIVNRSAGRSESLVSDLHNIPGLAKFSIQISNWINYQESLEDCDLLINSTSLGMKNMDGLEIDISNLKKEALVCDIVYQPLMTKLLIAARNRGNPIVNGIGMLIHQGLVGFESWFKIKPKVDQSLIEHILS